MGKLKLLQNVLEKDINDEFILSTFIKDNGKKNSSTMGFLIHEKLPVISNYLKNRYTDSQSYQETIWRIKNHVDIRPVCKKCGAALRFCNGFGTYCSSKCQNSDPDKIAKDKATKLERYGDANYNNMDKNKQACLAKYGVDSYSKTQECKDRLMSSEHCMGSKYFKEKSKQTKQERYGDPNYNNREGAEKTCLEKYGVKNTKQSQIAKDHEKETCLKRYGVTSYRKTKECEEKIRNTTMLKYGVEHVTQSKEWTKHWYSNKEWAQHKTTARLNSMKANNSYRFSKPEIYLYNELKKTYDDIIYQYNEERYPFNCDFYIPSKDLFIEYNGYWTHGKVLFDKDNENCIKQLNEWKKKEKEQIDKGNIKNLYTVAINTWTISDVKKVNMAKQNNLNYLILWYDDYKDINTIKNKIDLY